MLKNILAITGKPGLYKLVNHGTNMLIVESLLDGKRMPTYGRDKIISLSDISMFTTDDDLPLSEVLTRLGQKEKLQPAGIEPKKADNEALRAYFASFVPNYDVDRVYPSDIRKLVVWYNILIHAGITDFTVEEAEDNIPVQKTAAPEKSTKTPAKTQGKTQKSAAKASAKTGVGAKKG